MTDQIELAPSVEDRGRGGYSLGRSTRPEEANPPSGSPAPPSGMPGTRGAVEHAAHLLETILVDLAEPKRDQKSERFRW
jgi:hypothetical protein